MIMVIRPNKRYSKQLAKERERGARPRLPSRDRGSPSPSGRRAGAGTEPAEPDEVAEAELRGGAVEATAAENEG